MKSTDTISVHCKVCHTNMHAEHDHDKNQILKETPCISANCVLGFPLLDISAFVTSDI